MTTFDRIKPIIAETLNISLETVSESLAAGDIQEWDSMGNMAIIAALEERLGIEFPIDDLFELDSIESLVKEIDKLSR